MADNTVLNPGTGGDTVRDLARQSGSVKTQVFQLDLGGVTGNAEVLIQAGQQLMAASVPVVIASNQPSLGVTLGVGSAIAGKFGIDQTTPGTTNLIATNADGTISNGAAPSKSLIAGGIFNTTLPTLTTGQGAALQVDSNARQLVNVAVLPALVAGSAIVGKFGIDQTTIGTTNGVSLAQIGSTTIVNGGLAGSLGIGGLAADNATPIGNPIYICGGALVGANPTKATNGQTSALATDAVGRLITVHNHERSMTGCTATTITASITATAIVAAIAATFCDITSLSITNSSATATLVTLINNAVTYGVWNIPANGNIVIPFPTPLASGLINTAWTLTCTTSVSSIYVVASWVKNT